MCSPWTGKTLGLCFTPEKSWKHDGTAQPRACSAIMAPLPVWDPLLTPSQSRALTSLPWFVLCTPLQLMHSDVLFITFLSPPVREKLTCLVYGFAPNSVEKLTLRPQNPCLKKHLNVYYNGAFGGGCTEMEMFQGLLSLVPGSQGGLGSSL